MRIPFHLSIFYFKKLTYPNNPIILFYLLVMTHSFCNANTASFPTRQSYQLNYVQTNKTKQWSITLQDKNSIIIDHADTIYVIGFIQLNGSPISLNIQNTMPVTLKVLNFKKNISPPEFAIILKSVTNKLIMGKNYSIEKIYLHSLMYNKILWKETIIHHSESSGGFTTIAINFIKSNVIKNLKTTNKDMLIIREIQTSLPAKKAKPFMPGPPLERIFIFKNQSYIKYN
ncbi:MAG: hypothetical protein QM500_17270 [Methylococcales bacterium]